jgi:uncharacterized protein (TIGR03067 family)
MKAKWLGLSVLLVLGTSAAAAEKDSDAIQGTWLAEKVVYNGTDFYGGGQPKFRFVIKGDTASVEGNDEVKKSYARFTFKIDPTTTPRLFDIKITGGFQENAVMEGIYELKGDELKICIRIAGNERPMKFESPEGSSVVLVVLKREKP